MSYFRAVVKTSVVCTFLPMYCSSFVHVGSAQTVMCIVRELLFSTTQPKYSRNYVSVTIVVGTYFLLLCTVQISTSEEL